MKKSALIFLLICGITASQNIFAQKKKQSQANSVETGIQYLSGKGSDDAVDWEFFCTDGRNSGKWTTIPVPSCWELQGFGTYQYGMPFYGKANPLGIANEQGKYKYKFRLPKEWEGRVVRIVFDGVMTDYEAQINGRRCGYPHQGAFYRFKNDVSDRIFFGDKENVLEVTVSKESSNPSVNLAERRADYWNFGGIFRPVFVEALPAQFIDRTAIDADADGSFFADVFMGVAMGANSKVVAELTDINGKTIGKTLETPILGGSDKAIIRGKFDNIKNWTPETPNLYYVKFSLMDGDKVLHTVKERFGFRTIEVKPSDGIYVNGQKITVRGVNRHSFRPETGRTLSKQANYDDVKLIKEMNMNAVRLSHYPSDPEFLDACDELGLYVMVELAGWHGMYDSNVGAKLIKEMVTRDVNHPSVTWWANGNEGGHNHEIDKEFAPLDPQKRPLLHPQKNFGGFETMHYRSYGESQEYMRKPEIWMPTEFLHALYDGGAGAGLWDYWEVMRKHPRCAGGFIWMFADEGVVRTDQNNRIDNVGNYGADGIVGPHHEREGSFYTVKQVWSPVQIIDTMLPDNFDGTLQVENRYDFTNLKDCRFTWTLKNFSLEKESIVKTGEIKELDIAPHAAGELKINLPADWKKADALYVTAYNPSGEALWTWDWQWKKAAEFYPFVKENTSLSAKEDGDKLIVKAGSTELSFNKESGELSTVKENNKNISFGNGPRVIVARRGDRSMDMFYNHDDAEARSKERVYLDVSGENKLTNFDYQTSSDSITITADYFGNMRQAHWVIKSDGSIRLDYAYQYDGTVELFGIKFDYPEDQVKSKRWLGGGPYRVWQNRIHGTNFGIWENDYNDPIPGESFLYPEFKGYFHNWRWVNLNTTEGVINLSNGDDESHLGIYTPRDGRDKLLYTIPESGISVLKVIPAVRNKVNSTDLVGPSSWAKWVSGLQKGSIYLKFKAK
ncbi:glycoside hydrolase family 2 TIM barrel-domain containing protein [Dysgonomonas sp. 520]|uniref:glycoside hydrolase family 2 TIM barrel-domain containing protein n=1 Tax=Dysgonomonas sp. 520 TaxID=2302931 RepID=UPI0013D16F82|nr:glycoside hydrolase family 2 TIM barrel-domain containing protein [Dysgonomonas sp. 520]NDW09713.1 glycoside hydrolase family 2 [Dysgonomonas sp. 520]